MIAYIRTVTAAALIVSVLTALAGRGTMGTLFRLTAGVFMALTILSPVLKLELPDMESWISSFEIDGVDAAAAGEAMAEDARRGCIKERTQSYILDKAACYGASLKVEVVLDEEGMPAAVMLRGKISPYAKARMTQELEAELGLGKEVQRWIEEN